MQDDVTEYEKIDLNPDTIKELTKDFFINNNNKPLYEYITYVHTVLNNNIKILDNHMLYKTSNSKNYKHICVGLKQNLYCIIINTIIDLYKHQDIIKPIEFINKISSITNLINTKPLTNTNYNLSDFKPTFITETTTTNCNLYYKNLTYIKIFRIEFNFRNKILIKFVCNINETNHTAFLYKNGFLQSPECAIKINNFYKNNKIPNHNVRYYSNLYTIERNYNDPTYEHTLLSDEN